jgi:hypothetical protein
MPQLSEDAAISPTQMHQMHPSPEPDPPSAMPTWPIFKPCSCTYRAVGPAAESMVKHTSDLWKTPITARSEPCCECSLSRTGWPSCLGCQFVPQVQKERSNKPNPCTNRPVPALDPHKAMVQLAAVATGCVKCALQCDVIECGHLSNGLECAQQKPRAADLLQIVVHWISVKWSTHTSMLCWPRD